ncbi:uroporphyrinogen-III synthase [Marinobacter zhanjiangensis]|uniref:Uroporphyrinogen-III synthase n=1 Tax=Marinobacter zhanjiangensis TaxID=578215 RepID=A0ABQ3BB70_9GAMM|nr:uroporphyrinogen-III synthase [Marinobacter zhanjiangensis]GGY84200.1 uroporphyrinogen-III synthase [Marinobacter zhanjiangensis]
MDIPPANQSTPLDRVRVLVCRPEPEASRLAGAFRSAGARTRTLPVIERVPIPETPEHRQRVVDLDLYQHVIAVSPYAARQLLERVDTWWPQFPTGIRWYGVGASTAAVLENAGLTPEHPAEGFTSEALLALPPLQHLKHEKVLLARGDQGRELIRETLIKRGASVTVLPLYRRQAATPSAEQLTDSLERFRPDVIVALSGETLNNFIALSNNSSHNCLKSLLLVPTERVARQARDAGFTRVICASGMADEDIVNRVVACYAAEQAGQDQPPGSP